MFEIKQKTTDYMSVVLTHECNKKCPFCIDKYRGRLEYINKQNINAAASLAHKYRIKDILLVGGEPTLHPDIIEIAKFFKSEGFRVIMTTNYTKPKVVRKLDGIVDCFNISFYNQLGLSEMMSFESDITIHALIHKQNLQDKEELDQFIDAYKIYGHLKFSTLTDCNKWTKENKECSYLDTLDSKKVLLFNEIEGNIYRDCVIKRHDRIINKSAKQSIKFHVDGVWSISWDRLNIKKI